jgi:two-component system LytT family response regulator
VTGAAGAAMRVLLVEDERPALDQLAAAVRAWSADVEIAGAFATVRETVAWLRAHDTPDLILADVQLADGLSFRIFEQVPTTAPVVFCTAYDAYLGEALARAGIDYILKPLEVPRLFAALDKYVRLRAHFGGRVAGVLGDLRRAGASERLLGRRGADFVSLALDDVAYFLSENKLAILVDREGRHHVLDESLAELDARLPAERFFRANRQYLVSAPAVARFRSLGKGRLAVELRPRAPDEVVVSQENGAAFRAWLGRRHGP